ncbi:hypothetical protein IGI04_041097 [Brassica rapa subsp. trilocularis]|uniref:Cysteine-rich transmembrane domain-containing protein n=1 Tax=Brassica rapa subsp. trilocularis TaxID=1813537 RepID=A0ABQ7KQZ9_BRACM|nr:hypothetical protein IGI04_041097 [Brassica rapa subsp. trilocularis]
MNQSSVVEKPSQGPYTSPPPIGYPTRDAVVGDPRVSSVETKSKGDDGLFARCWFLICCCCVLDNCCR